MDLETKRLIIRPLEVGDLEDYIRIHNDPFVLKYSAMVETNRERALAYLSKQLETELALEEKASGKVIGVICLEEDSLRWGVESIEFAYFLGQPYARRGYMKEALGAVIGEIFRQGKADSVCARCFLPNIASQRLLESLGFHRDGVIRRCVKGYGGVIYDDVIYSLLREEFCG